MDRRRFLKGLGIGLGAVTFLGALPKQKQDPLEKLIKQPSDATITFDLGNGGVNIKGILNDGKITSIESAIVSGAVIPSGSVFSFG